MKFNPVLLKYSAAPVQSLHVNSLSYLNMSRIEKWKTLFNTSIFSNIYYRQKKKTLLTAVSKLTAECQPSHHCCLTLSFWYFHLFGWSMLITYHWWSWNITAVACLQTFRRSWKEYWTTRTSFRITNALFYVRLGLLEMVLGSKMSEASAEWYQCSLVVHGWRWRSMEPSFHWIEISTEALPQNMPTLLFFLGS